MPDWQKLVSQRLAYLALGPREHREVVEELSAHLEEIYEGLLRSGMAKPEAARRALAEVTDWKHLSREIQSAKMRKGTVTNRVTQLWLPGLLTFALSMGLLTVAQEFSSRPLVLSLGPGTPFLKLYPIWFLVLPFAGAVGAYISKRAGGSLRMALASSLFPILPFGAVFMIAIPAGLLMWRSVSIQIVAAASLNMVAGWVLVPAVALLAGGLLVQFLLSPQLTSRDPVGH